EVTETFMRKLLEDARWAPNHLMRQLWRFIFVGQKELPEFAKKVAQTYPEKQHKKTHKGVPFPWRNLQKQLKTLIKSQINNNIVTVKYKSRWDSPSFFI